MDNLQKIKIAREVIDGAKIKDTARKWGISATTVRRYMDLYTEKKLPLDVKEIIEDCWIHAHLGKNEKDTASHIKRFEHIAASLKALTEQVRRES